jgi:hypothetical protein
MEIAMIVRPLYSARKRQQQRRTEEDSMQESYLASPFPSTGLDASGPATMPPAETTSRELKPPVLLQPV